MNTSAQKVWFVNCFFWTILFYNCLGVPLSIFFVVVVVVVVVACGGGSGVIAVAS